jgi:WD40 repeat protein
MMSTSSSSDSRDYGQFDVLAQEFAERLRRGERPRIQEYVDRLPELADEIREMFPALVEVERADAHVRDDADRPPPSATPRLRELGDYRILREVGRGGMGVVYEAEQVSLGRRVALKILPSHVVGDRKTQERFLREAKAAARLHHTNIVPVYEVGRDGDVSFYAMQLIQGQGLDQVIDELRRLRQQSLVAAGHAPGAPEGKGESATPTAARLATTSLLRKRDLGKMAELLMTGSLAAVADGPPGADSPMESGLDATAPFEPGTPAGGTLSEHPQPRPVLEPHSSAVLPGGKHVSEVDTSGRRQPFFRSVAQIGRQVAQGLAYAHARGVVHRDVKPSNLLLDTDGIVWITDFGLAKADDDGLTATGDILGTLRYMAPERFRGAGDARADVYSLGMTLYELLTLHPAYESSDRLKLIGQIKALEPTRPRSIDNRIPRDLETITLKAIDKDPDRRYASMDAMAEDLRRFLVDEPIRARQISATERYWRWARRNPVIATLGGVLTGVLVLVTLGSLLAAGRFASLAERQRRAADSERGARFESDKARKAAQLAALETKKTAARAQVDKEIAERESYRSTIKLAESMLQGDARSRYHVADILWGARPELRGWEWGHLMARCPLEEWSLQTGQGGVAAVTASPDGRLFATAGNDGTVALWDSWTRRAIWRRDVGKMLTLEIDPQGRYVGVGSHDESKPAFRILALTTGQVVHETAEKGPAQLAFGPDGKDAYVLRPGMLERLGTDAWTRRSSVPNPKAESWEHLRLFVDAVGRYVGVHAVKGFGDLNERRMALFDARTLRAVSDFDTILPTRQTNLGSEATPFLHSGFGELVSSDGPILHTLRLVMDANDQGRHAELLEHPNTIRYFAYDPRSKTLIVASADGTVTLRDADGETRELYHGLPIGGLALFPDGRFLTVGADGLLKCWVPERSFTPAVNIDAAPSFASDCILTFASGGGSLLYRSWETESHYIYDIKTLRYKQYTTPGGGDIGSRFPMVRPGTGDLVVDTRQGLDFYRRLADGRRYSRTQSVDFTQTMSAAFDASGRILAVCSKDRRLAAFDLSTNKRLPAPEARGRGMVSVNPAGTRAALATGVSVQVWDVATGRLLNRIDWESPSFDPPDDHGELLRIDHSAHIGLDEASFHPNADVLVFIKHGESSSSLVVWEISRGKVLATIPAQPGILLESCEFSLDGNRVLTACSDGMVRLWDWRLGKELLALSDAAHTMHATASPDGVTLAYSGWHPSLRIAKALPWDKSTRRNDDFYRALDDLWTYSIKLSPGVKTPATSKKAGHAVPADEAETLGDVECRRGGRVDNAPADYARAVKIRQWSVLDDPASAPLQYRLATAYEKWLAVEAARDAGQGASVLQQAAEFWQKLVATGHAPQAAWRYCLDFQFRLLDRQLAGKESDAQALLLPQVEIWCERSARGPNGPREQLLRYALGELWARLVRAAPGFTGDDRAVDALVDRHPELIVTVGDQYAADKNWERALAIYGRAPCEESGFDHIRRLLALAGAEADGEERPLDDEVKTRLRQKALDRLRAELAALTRRLESDPQKDLQAIAQAVAVWEQDLGLASVREANGLDRLNADERKAWQALWADVDAFQKRLPPLNVAEAKPAGNETARLDQIHRRAHELAGPSPKLAEPLFREALAGFREVAGPGSESVIDLSLDLAQVLDRIGRAGEAEPLLRRVLDELDVLHGGEHPHAIGAKMLLGLCLARQDKWAEAKPILRQMIDAYREQVGANDPRLAGTLGNLGLELIGMGQWAQAEPYARECLAIREKTQPDEWSTFNARSILGGSLLGQKKFAEAEPLIVSGYEGLKAREARIPPAGKPRLEEAAERTVKLYEAWGKPEKAADWRARLAKRVDGPKP